jgi:hypothetical protein
MCLLFSAVAPAQTNKVAVLRELRITCLETFNTTHERLEELRSFVELQTSRQRAAADQLFQLGQTAAAANRRILDLQQKRTTTKTAVEQSRITVERAVTSYQAAGQTLPRGEPWADDGAKALTELRRAADATPRDQWKHLRVKEAEAQFASTIRDWRAARREFERAGFDLELRAASVIFTRISNQLVIASTELESLATLLTNRASRAHVVKHEQRAVGQNHQGTERRQCRGPEAARQGRVRFSSGGPEIYRVALESSGPGRRRSQQSARPVGTSD